MHPAAHLQRFLSLPDLMKSYLPHMKKNASGLQTFSFKEERPFTRQQAALQATASAAKDAAESDIIDKAVASLEKAGEPFAWYTCQPRSYSRLDLGDVATNDRLLALPDHMLALPS